MFEWVRDRCLTPSEHFSTISWREHVPFWWDDDDEVCSFYKVHTGIYEIIITLQRTFVTILNYNTENNKKNI